MRHKNYFIDFALIKETVHNIIYNISYYKYTFLRGLFFEQHPLKVNFKLNAVFLLKTTLCASFGFLLEIKKNYNKKFTRVTSYTKILSLLHFYPPFVYSSIINRYFCTAFLPWSQTFFLNSPAFIICFFLNFY